MYADYAQRNAQLLQSAQPLLESIGEDSAPEDGKLTIPQRAQLSALLNGFEPLPVSSTASVKEIPRRIAIPQEAPHERRRLYDALENLLGRPKKSGYQRSLDEMPVPILSGRFHSAERGQMVFTLVALGVRDFGGMNLAYADLAGVDLAGADLIGANLVGADLTGANLVGTSLAGANLTGAYLNSANLTGAYLNSTTLTGANLSDADLADADLTGSILVQANFTNATLANAILTGGANLAKADLTGVNLAGASIAQYQLEDACGMGAVLPEKLAGLKLAPCRRP